MFHDNKIVDNGDATRGYGVFVEATNQDEVFEHNIIAETRTGKDATQRYGFYIAKGNSSLSENDNEMKGHSEADYYDENATAMK